MLKLIALNYTVMLNGYSQWLNIQGIFFIATSVVLKSVMLAFNHKKSYRGWYRGRNRIINPHLRSAFQTVKMIN